MSETRLTFEKKKRGRGKSKNIIYGQLLYIVSTHILYIVYNDVLSLLTSDVFKNSFRMWLNE